MTYPQATLFTHLAVKYQTNVTALVLAGIYEINQEKTRQGFYPGIEFHLELGHQPVPADRRPGVAGNRSGRLHQSQLQDNHSSDQSLLLNSPNQVHAMGGQIGLALPKANAQVNFSLFFEFDAESRLQCDYAGLTAAWDFKGGEWMFLKPG